MSGVVFPRHTHHKRNQSHEKLLIKLFHTSCNARSDESTGSLVQMAPRSNSNEVSGKGAAMASETFRLPFPWALHKMLDDSELFGFSHIVSWSPDGTCFKVHDKNAFMQLIIHKYFRQTKYKSFQRQLHIYGFSRITKGKKNRGMRCHELFIRNKVNLCVNMKPKRQKCQQELISREAIPDSTTDLIRSNVCFEEREQGTLASMGTMTNHHNIAMQSACSDSVTRTQQKENAKATSFLEALFQSHHDSTFCSSSRSYQDLSRDDASSCKEERQPSVCNFRPDGEDFELVPGAIAFIKEGAMAACNEQVGLQMFNVNSTKATGGRAVSSFSSATETNVPTTEYLDIEPTPIWTNNDNNKNITVKMISSSSSSRISLLSPQAYLK